MLTILGNRRFPLSYYVVVRIEGNVGLKYVLIIHHRIGDILGLPTPFSPRIGDHGARGTFVIINILSVF